MTHRDSCEGRSYAGFRSTLDPTSKEMMSFLEELKECVELHTECKECVKLGTADLLPKAL